MVNTKEEFLERLEIVLKDHPRKDEILIEYDLHITEMLRELSNNHEVQSDMEYVIDHFGTPEEILDAWKDELSITPSKAKWNFVFVNSVFFSFGILLTLLHNLFDWHWIGLLWEKLTSITGIIIFLYILFWGLLGYEIGRAFGPNGKKLLFKTFILSVIPNLLLMYLILFNIIPHEWFQPLINKKFIIICVVFTFILYPICHLGYSWGKKDSVL
jgi:hypothetical protein